MKKKHMKYKFEAVDHLRTKSIEMANTWKLEKDLNDEVSTRFKVISRISKIIFQTKIYLNTSLSSLTVHELRLSPKDDQKQLQRLRRLEHMSHHTTSSLVILSFNNRFLNLH